MPNREISLSTYLMSFTLFALNFFDLLPSWKDLFFFPPVRLFLAPAPPLRMKNDIVSSRKHRWKVKDDKVFATRVHNRSKNIKHSFEINVCRGFLLHEFQSFYVQFWASLVKNSNFIRLFGLNCRNTDENNLNKQYQWGSNISHFWLFKCFFFGSKIIQ